MWSLDIYGRKKKVLIGGEETPVGDLGMPAQFANAGLALYQIGPDLSSPNAQEILKFQQGLSDEPTSEALGQLLDGSSGGSLSAPDDTWGPSGASAPIASFEPVASSEPIQEENLLRGRGLDPSILSEFPGGTTNLLKGPGLDASILDQLNDDRLASSIPAPQPSPGAGYYNAPMVRTLGDKKGSGDGGDLKLPSEKANASKVVFPTPGGAPQQATPGKLLSDSSLRNDLAREQQRADAEQAARDFQEALAATAASNDRPIRSTPNYFQDTPPIALSMAPAAVPPVPPRPTPQDSLGISPSDPRKEVFREGIPFYQPKKPPWALLPTYSHTESEYQIVASARAAVGGYYNFAANLVNSALFWPYAIGRETEDVEDAANLTPGTLTVGTPGFQTIGLLPETIENFGVGLNAFAASVTPALEEAFLDAGSIAIGAGPGGGGLGRIRRAQRLRERLQLWLSDDEFEERILAELGGALKKRYPLSEARPSGDWTVELDHVGSDGMLSQIKRITSPNGTFSRENQAQFTLTVDAVRVNGQSVFRYFVSIEAPEEFLRGLREMPLPEGMTLLIELFSAKR